MNKLRLFTLNNPRAMVINSDLAVEIGFNESIVFLQLEFLIRNSTSEEHEGRKWTYQSLTDLKENYFPWWSKATIKRAIDHLVEMGLICVGNFNRYKYDRTQWYALCYQGIEALSSVKVGGDETCMLQNETRFLQNETQFSQNETTIPEIPTENTTEINDDEVGETPEKSEIANQPNIFELYESEIGILTPMISDSLKCAVGDYPDEWIREALRISAKNNKRSWSYVETILKRWRVDGFQVDNRRGRDSPAGGGSGRKNGRGRGAVDTSELDEIIKAAYGDEI